MFESLAPETAAMLLPLLWDHMHDADRLAVICRQQQRVDM